MKHRAFFNKLLSNSKIKDFLMINFGVFLVALAFSLFLDRYEIIIGGIGGIAIILKNFFFQNLTSSLFILILNVLLLFVALIFLGKEFFLKTIFASIIYPFYAWIIEISLEQFEAGWMLTLEQDYLLIIIVSAIITGIGMGFAIKHGSSTGGMDIPQYILLKYFNIPISLSIILLDGIVILTGAIVYRSMAMFFYGIVFAIISGYLIDSIVFGGFNVRAAHIITKNPEEVKQKIFQKLGRGVTEIYSRGGFTGTDNKILVCVLTTREYHTLRSIVQTIDATAFIYAMKASEVHGEGFTYGSKSD